MLPGWGNPKHGKDWLSSMERFAFPRLGKLPVSEVTSADVVEALRSVWHERPATARRVRQRISTVMEWAVALNYRDDNPCSRIGPVLGPQQDLVQHMRALPHPASGRSGAGRDGAGIRRGARRQARVRVSGAHRGAVRRGAWCTVGRDRHGRPRVDHPGHTDQGEARAPRPAVRPGAGDPQCGAIARRRERARVPEREGQADERHGPVGTAQDADAPACRAHGWGLARTQRNRVLAFTSRVFRQFEQWEWREQNTNPARGVERARETPRDRTLAPSELAALARALDDMAGAYPASVAAIRFAAVTGLRIGEVLAIRWEDVDLEQSRLTMPETKTGRRQHDLRAAALAILRELMRVNDCPWAFTTTGRAGLSYRPVRVHFGEAVRAAGLADVRLHDLRRTVNDASGGGWSRNARSP